MKNTIKRLLSMVLVMAMVVSMFPVSAFATDVEGEQPEEIVAEPPVHEHSYVAGASTASCTAEGTVTYVCGCGDSYEELAAATGHSYVAGESVPASCEVDGSITMTCVACGDSYVETLPAGHSYVETAKLDATCTVDGSITMTCSACGHSYTDPMVAPGHSMSYDILDATCTEDGYTKGICTVCGENFEEVHMALGHAWINGVCDRCDVVYYDLMMAAETAVDMLAVYNAGDVAARMSLYLEQLNDLNEKTEAFETLTDEEISVLDAAAAKRATEEVEAKEELLAAWAELIELKTPVEEEPVEDEIVKTETEEPAIDAAAEVQAMIDALPTTFASEEEVDAFWLYTETLDAAYEALTEEQRAQVDITNYNAAMDAAAAFFNPEFDNAGVYKEVSLTITADSATYKEVYDKLAAEIPYKASSLDITGIAGAYTHGYKLYSGSSEIAHVTLSSDSSKSIPEGTYEIYTGYGLRVSWSKSEHTIKIVKDLSAADFKIKEDSDNTYEIDYNFYKDYNAVSEGQNLKGKVFDAVVDTSSSGMTANDLDISVEIDIGIVTQVSLWDKTWGGSAVVAFGNEGDGSTETVVLSYKNTKYTVNLKLNESREAAEIDLNNVKASYTANDANDLINKIKADVVVKDNEGSTTAIPSNSVKVELDKAPTADGANCVATVTVTDDGASWLENTDGKKVTVEGVLAKYTVTWYDEDGTTVLDSQEVANGTTPVYAGEETIEELVAAKNNAQYSYAFSWTPAVSPLNGEDASYTATYTPAVNKYLVTFVDGNGKTLQSGEVEYGTVPTYTGENPTKLSTNTQNFTFNNSWDKEIVAVTGIVTYTAQFDASTRYYTVTFQNEDGTELQKLTNLEYNQTPVYTGEDATKAAVVDDNGVTKGTYKHDGWTEDVTPVTSDNKVYTAKFEYVTSQYTITWTANGETFASQTKDYGTVVTLPAGTPADYVDGNGTNWTFDKWDVPADLGTIAGDKEYFAVYKVSGNDAKIIHADLTESYCKDLATALKQAVAGETVVMLADATMSSKIYVDKDITIDGGNYKIIADNHSSYILETNSDCTIKNVTLDTNNKAKGVLITSGDVVFDNVTIPNSNKGDAITVKGTLTLKTYFKAVSSYSVIDARSGVVNAEPGTVFDMTTFRGNVSPATSDLKGAVGTDGKSYFAAYSSTSYFTNKNLPLSLNGLTLLKDMELSGSKTINGNEKIDLNGNALIITDDKSFTVNGTLTVNGEGSIDGDMTVNGTLVVTGESSVDGKLILNNADARVVGAKDLPVVAAENLEAVGCEVVYDETTGTYSLRLDLPEVAITDIKGSLTENDPDLTFALNFAIKDMENLSEEYLNELMAFYGDWYTDYVLTISGLTDSEVIFNANSDAADGYLAGQYDAFGENWLSVPFEDVSIANGESLYIMEYAAKLMGQSGLRFTLAEIAAIVQNFDCGVFFTPEFLAANPGMQVTLELKVFTEDENGNKINDISVAENDFAASEFVAIIAAEDKQTEYYGTLAAALAAAEAGETVTLLTNADANGAVVNKNITLELNGKAVTGEIKLGAADVKLNAAEGLTVTSGVELMSVVYEDGKYSLINDANGNGVLDDEETFTLKVSKANDADAVVVSGEGLVENPLSTADSTGYIFDSTKNTITITATPVVADGKSTTYVKSIGEAELKFGDKFVATAEIAVENGDEIVVEFADAKFAFTGAALNYYPGAVIPSMEELYSTFVSEPPYADGETVVTVKYLAREAYKQTINISSLPIGDTLKNIISYIGYDSFEIDLPDVWLAFDAQIEDSVDLDTAISLYLDEALFAEAYKAFENKGGWLGILSGSLTAFWNVVEGGIAEVTEAIYYHGAHPFGYNPTDSNVIAETVQITYKSDAMYIEAETQVNLEDQRAASQITGNNISVIYSDYTNADLISAIGATVSGIDGSAVDYSSDLLYTLDISDEVSVEGRSVGEYTVTYKFKGNETHKPSEAQFTITISKASASIDLPDLIVTHGEAYNADPAVTMGNKYGNASEINESLIRVVLGLDVAELDVDGDGVKGVEGRIQLILPAELQNMIQGIIGEAGVDMSLSELLSYLDVLPDDTLGGLSDILGSLSEITEASDLRITLGGQMPTDIGVYLYGAVSTSSNYETAYDVGYIVIKPDAQRVYMDFDYNDTNGIFTYELLKHISMSASAYNDSELTDKNEAASAMVNNLFIGVDQNGEMFFRFYDAETPVETITAELGNGAYTQLAFIADFGNEMFYAVPVFRAFAIVPSVVDVQLVGATGDHNRDLHKVFNGQNQGFSVKVYEAGEMIYSDHYQDAVNKLPEGAEIKVTYLGVQTNGQTYNSTIKPIHAGAYTAIASYIYIDEDGNLNELGADAGVLVIEPSESTITMSETETVLFGENYNVVDTMDIKASSVNAPAEFVTDPDFTVITASVAATNDVSENGWAGVTGNVNVDFPKWVDTLLGIEEDDVLDAGNLVAEIEKVSNSIDSVIAMLGLDANYTAEAKEAVLARVEESFAKVNELLTQLPENTSITFKSDYAVNAVGAYAVVAVVTDSDHYPSVDAGLLVIAPAHSQAYLKFNYEDANGIFSRSLLKIDGILDATAYTDETYTTVHADDAKVVDAFLTIDAEGNLVTITDESKLTNGAWLQLSYIPLELGGYMTISDLIARPVVIVPDMGDVELVYSDAKDTQDKFEFKFDGTGKGLQIAYNGELAAAKDYVIYYEGVQTNGKYYERSTKAPVHAGAYIAVGLYNENGILDLDALGDYDAIKNSEAIGADVAMITIDLAESSISVTGGNVVYDGEEHKATITTDGRCDKTIISGYVNVTGAVDTVGVDAFVGNVNMDFPRWVDEIIATYEFSDGITPAYMKDLLESYVDEIMAKLPVDALAYIGMSKEDVEAAAFAVFNEIITLLEKMPQDVSITFENDVTYTEPGAYLYLGIVTDSDRVPSYDTGLLIIEKMKNKFDMLDTTVTYNGEEQFVKYVNEYNTDYFTMIVDRETNTVNLVLDPDMMYVLDKLQQLTGYNLADGVPVSSLYSQLNAEELAAAIIATIEDVEAAAVLNPEGDLNKVLTMLKTELETLPTSGQFVVNQPLPVDVGTYEVYTMAFAELYSTEFSKAVLTIVPAEVTVTAENKTKAYGEADPELTYTVEGLVEGDEINVTIAREPGEDIGIYAITLDADAGKNYTVTVVPGTLKITPALITVKMDDQTKVYGDADPSFTYTIETAYAGEFMLVVEQSREAGENVGTYAISPTAYVFMNDNFAITVVPGTLTITQKHVTVTAENKTKVYGEADPELTYIVDGLVEGDEINVTIAREPGEDVGIYAITLDADAGKNYTVTVNNGTLTVMKVSVTGVTLDKDTLTLGKDETAELTATVAPENATNKKVTWSSSDESVVTVDENGKVTAVGRGTATITVTTVEGEFTATCTVTVRYGYPIYFTNANDAAIVAPGMTVLIDGVPYVLDENCTAWAEEDDDHRRIALLYDYTEQGDAANPFEYADHCENMYVWDLERNEETAEYTANRVTELDNVLKFSGGSIWLSGSGVNGIRAYYDYKGTAEAFAKLGYEVVSHGTVLDWAENLGATGEAERRYTEAGASANFAAGHYEGGNTYTDTIYPASEKYVSNPVRMRFYAELKDIEPDAETGETEDIMLYSGSVQRSIGYIAWQNRDAYNGTVYDNYVEKIIDQARDHLIEEGLIEG